jgi:hypothetical protein
MPDSITADRVKVTTANGFVVVTKWRPRAGTTGPATYEYTHFTKMEDAESDYHDYERGDYPRAEPVGIFACLDGLPFGPALWRAA